MQTRHTTQRLVMEELIIGDAGFILELVNTPEWIKFIGDRNVRTIEDALAYVQRIMNNKTVRYWVVKLKEQLVPVGVITFIKRDYLEHSDLGFAFLPQYSGKGYAFEASSKILNDLIRDHGIILATTMNDNVSSIALLKKLGFGFDKQIIHDQTPLMVYSVTKKTIISGYSV